MYRFFDLCLESELELPGLARSEAAQPDWSVWRRERAVDLESFDWLHSWESPGGETVMAVARENGAYVLEFPGMATFFIDFQSRSLAIEPAAGCGDDTLVHLLLDQVLPRAICHEGRVVIHASAVALPDGGALAFSGVSGKSTLAAAFHRAGHRLLSDDCLLLKPMKGTVYAIPAYSSVRLWQDSLDAVFADDQATKQRTRRMAHYTRKHNLQLQADAAAQGLLPSPLKALFLLEPPASTGQAPSVRIAKANGMSAIMAIVEAQFALDVTDRDAVKRGFETVSEVAGCVPVWRLTYPRDFTLLSHVVDEIRQCS